MSSSQPPQRELARPTRRTPGRRRPAPPTPSRWRCGRPARASSRARCRPCPSTGSRGTARRPAPDRWAGPGGRARWAARLQPVGADALLHAARAARPWLRPRRWSSSTPAAAAGPARRPGQAVAAVARLGQRVGPEADERLGLHELGRRPPRRRRRCCRGRRRPACACRPRSGCARTSSAAPCGGRYTGGAGPAANRCGNGRRARQTRHGHGSSPTRAGSRLTRDLTAPATDPRRPRRPRRRPPSPDVPARGAGPAPARGSACACHPRPFAVSIARVAAVRLDGGRRARGCSAGSPTRSWSPGSDEGVTRRDGGGRGRRHRSAWRCCGRSAWWSAATSA